MDLNLNYTTEMNETEKLLIACKLENVEGVKHCLSNGGNPNGLCKDGRTPIGLAAQTGNVSILRQLVLPPKENEVNWPNIKLKSKPNLGYYVYVHEDEKKEAISRPTTTDLQLNLHDNFEPEVLITPEGMDNLEWDVEINEDENLLLFELDSDPLSNLYKWYANILSATSKFLVPYEKTLRDLLNTQDQFGWTPLHYAAREGHVPAIEFLISKGSEIDVESGNGLTPFLLATFHGKTEAVKALLKFGSNPHLTTPRHQMSALHVAAYHGYYDIASLLLQSKVEVNCFDLKDTTPLGLAISNGYYSIVKLLLDNNAKIQFANTNGTTALSVAIKNKDLSMTRLLLENNAQVPPGYLILHGIISLVAQTGAYEENADIVRRIAELTPFANQLDAHGDTPLMAAIKQQMPLDLLRILLKNGANASYKGHGSEQSSLIDTIPQEIIETCERYESLLQLFNEFNYEPTTDFFFNALSSRNTHAVVIYVNRYGLPEEHRCHHHRPNFYSSHDEHTCRCDRFDLQRLLTNEIFDSIQIQFLTTAAKYRKPLTDVPTLFHLCIIRIRRQLKTDILRKLYQLPLLELIIHQIRQYPCPCSCKPYINRFIRQSNDYFYT